MGGVILASLLRIKKYRVGFSLILCNEIHLAEGASIGHLNVIVVDKLIMGKNTRIGHLNFIKGWFDLNMAEKASIHLQNKITRILSPQGNYCKATLDMKYHAKIGVKHLLDMTRNITIGENSMLAGSDSQIWTHGFYFSKLGEQTARIDGDVTIGHNCYIGARCVILSSVRIGNAVTIGANACVSKSILKQGLYVSQPLRSIPFDPDEAIKRLSKRIATINHINIYEK